MKYEVITRELVGADYVEMLEWIVSNIKGAHSVWYYRWRTVEDIKRNYGVHFTTSYFGTGCRRAKFEFVEDMLLFKLRWC
jgi:hypothetical protein